MLEYWLSQVGISEKKLWRMSWLELDARCHLYQRKDWDRWNHTRHIMAVFTGQKPMQIVTLPTDIKAAPKNLAPPDSAWVEAMRQRALSMN